MNTEFKNMEDLSCQIIIYIKENFKYPGSNISKFIYCFKKITYYLDNNNLDMYSPEQNSDIKNFYFQDRPIRSLLDYEQELLRSLSKISEFFKTRKISIQQENSRNYEFPGEIGVLIIKFLEFKRQYISLRSLRLNHYTLRLSGFCKYCIEKNINRIYMINIELIIDFISQLDNTKATTIETNIIVLRNFLKYLFELKFIEKDISALIPKHYHINQAKLPSTYSVDEIEILLKSVFRNSKVGKRDYAILLLATRLGLRASDIANLKFENLNWMKSTIELKIFKTGENSILPLLPDVGNALIEYIRYGRPIFDSPFVFLTCKYPITTFSSSNVVTHIVQRLFKRAGIDIRDRKFGPHTLRHSLTDKLLKNKIGFPQISSILAHKSSDSTMYYLRIDLKTLSMCTLEIPPIEKKFYEQKGGFFYE